MLTLLRLARRPPLLAFYLALLLFFGGAFFAEQYRPPAPALISGIALPSAAAKLSAETAEADQTAAAATVQAAAIATPPLAAAAEPTWLEYRIRRGDTMDKVLRAINADEEMRAYLTRQKMKTYRLLRRGAPLYFQQDMHGRVIKLLYKTSPQYYYTAGRDAQGRLWAAEEPPQTTASQYVRSGVIDTSLYAAADAADIDGKTADKLIQILETQIDFYREVRKGDSFRVIYEARKDDYGALVDSGSILAFEYNSRLESRPRVIRGAYFENDKVSGFYTPQGESLQRAFLPAPLRYRRISSRFTNRRFHPILKRWRPHRGVDYAARSGTPVHTTADGVVYKVSRNRGYGRFIMIKHFNNVYTTVYAHLRAFRRGIKRGKRVKQGDIIGYVGQTGLATGPHLHYEFRVRGKYRNPLSANLPKQLPPLKGSALKNFLRHSRPLFTALDAAMESAAEAARGKDAA